MSRIGKIRTGLLLLGTPLLVLSRLDVPLAEALHIGGLGGAGIRPAGHWIAAYNYFWAILRKGRMQSHHDGGTT